MGRCWSRLVAIAFVTLGPLADSRSPGQEVRLVERAPDPHGSPRPVRDARDVPPRTSLYLELGLPPGSKAGAVDPETVSITLQPEGGAAIALLREGRRFAAGTSGWLRPKHDLSGAESLAIYIEPGGPLKPATRYTVHVSAGPTGGAG